MSKTLNMIGTALRWRAIPRSISYQLWRSVSRRQRGERFFFRTSLLGQSLTYRGVCESSDDSLFVDLNEYERGTVNVLTVLLRNETAPVVFDIGANGGQFMMIVKALCQSAEVHCFEPFPELASFIGELVDRNSLSGVHVNNVLLGESDGMGNIHYSDGATATASTVHDFQPSFNKTLRVTQRTLDAYTEEKKIRRISLVKIDVEGGEREVLRGATAVLQRMRPNIILELLYPQNPGHLKRQEEAISTLRQLGYRFFQIEQNGMLTEQSRVTPDPTYTLLNYLVSTEDLSTAS